MIKVLKYHKEIKSIVAFLIHELQLNYCKYLYCIGFHTVMPKSDASNNGSLSMFNWIKVGWNAMNIPKFNPMQVWQRCNSFHHSFLLVVVDFMCCPRYKLLLEMNEKCNGKSEIGRVQNLQNGKQTSACCQTA